MADIVTVEAKALEGLVKGLEVLHKEMSAVGASLRKTEFRAPSFYARTNLVESVASGLEACVLTARELTKAAKEKEGECNALCQEMKAKAEEADKAKKSAEAERDSYAEMAEDAVKSAEALASGLVPCKDCAGLEKASEAKKGCKACGGAGFVKADAYARGGAYKDGKLPGRGSAIRTAV